MGSPTSMHHIILLLRVFCSLNRLCEPLEDSTLSISWYHPVGTWEQISVCWLQKQLHSQCCVGEAALIGASHWVLITQLHLFAQPGGAGGSCWAFRQMKPSWHFSDKQARPRRCCPCVIHFLILRAGLYIYLNSIVSSQTQPNYSKQWGSTFRG